MHTCEISAQISGYVYRYLHDHLPAMKRVSRFTERTNFYSRKGILQIELREHQYMKYGLLLKSYYLVLRINPSIIVGDSRALLINLEKYSADIILEKLQKRLYEINEFRVIRLHELPVSIFQTNRADLAVDLLVDNPRLLTWLANMSICKYRNFKRKIIYKETDTYYESCCFYNGSRKLNFYCKLAEMLNNRKVIEPKEAERIKHICRAEIQILKRGIYALDLPERRSLKPFLQADFVRNYVEKELCHMFAKEPYVNYSTAISIIQSSNFNRHEQAVMLSIIDTIPRFRGLYELETAIDEGRAPAQYGGNSSAFRQRWLAKFKRLGIQPVTIPDHFNIPSMPSIPFLLGQFQGENHEQQQFTSNPHGRSERNR